MQYRLLQLRVQLPAHVFDYINFTNVTDQMLLERFLDGDGSDANDSNGPNGSVGAFRDIGIRVFDSFDAYGWGHSYAAMVGNGNGNGLDRTDNNNEKDLYLYWAPEKVCGGNGPYRAAAEYIDAYGRIFNGSDGGAVPGSPNNAGTAVASLNIAPKGNAEGYYVHLGYAVTAKIELDLRYDYLDRLSNDDNAEREFTSWTLGAQYFFKTRSPAPC